MPTRTNKSVSRVIPPNCFQTLQRTPNNGERLKALAYEANMVLKEAMDDELPEVGQTRQSHDALSVRELKEICTERLQA